ncbi:LamG domain-containing protein [Ralstonia insidiosa]|uniref:LamG domain-containing protein n=1 Tax=Ralstonia insidiosa TaxID=190721 RepID=A0A848NWD7_9RALS|nr:LamG domain-containing protein [Ralstonia insidiosa]NMV37253.1 LamG domain-containing protein [Ralstonia insidiosa]
MIPAFTRYRSSGGGGDPYFSQVALLLHGEGANNGTVFTDSSGYNHVLAVGGSPKTSTTSPKFGSASIAFGGTGTDTTQPGATVDYLDLPSDTSTALGTGDFTIETWVKLNALPPQYGGIFDCRPPSSNGAYPALFVQNNGALLYYVNGGYALSTSLILSTGVWTHVAVVRRSEITTVYIGGISGGTYNDSNNYVNNRMRIGGSGYGNYLGLNGNLDEFRFTPGVARYSANFTPPIAPFPDHS